MSDSPNPLRHLVSGAAIAVLITACASAPDDTFTRDFDVDVDQNAFAECVVAPSSGVLASSFDSHFASPYSDLIEVSSAVGTNSPRELRVVVRKTDEGSNVTWQGPASFDNEAMIAEAITCAQERAYLAWVDEATPEDVARDSARAANRARVIGFYARATFNSDR